MSGEFKINNLHLDLLKELANIGVGNAATSLSLMIQDERVTMEVPQATAVSLQAVPESMGDPEQLVTATYFEATSKEIELILLFVLPLNGAQAVVDLLLPDNSGGLGLMERSLLMELGNIIAGAFLNALSMMTGISFMPSPPDLAVDMAGAILGSVVAVQKLIDDHLILLKTTIHAAGEKIEGTVLILPDFGSLKKLFALLGVSL